jgi:hypothetical protein
MYEDGPDQASNQVKFYTLFVIGGVIYIGEFERLLVCWTLDITPNSLSFLSLSLLSLSSQAFKKGRSCG